MVEGVHSTRPLRFPCSLATHRQVRKSLLTPACPEYTPPAVADASDLTSASAHTSRDPELQREGDESPQLFSVGAPCTLHAMDSGGSQGVMIEVYESGL